MRSFWAKKVGWVSLLVLALGACRGDDEGPSSMQDVDKGESDAGGRDAAMGAMDASLLDRGMDPDRSDATMEVDADPAGFDAARDAAETPADASDASEPNDARLSDGDVDDAEHDAAMRDAVVDGTASDAHDGAPSDAAVDDEAPNDAAPTPVLYLFDGSGKAGALGGRDEVDALCNAAKVDAGVPIVETRAFISVTDTDEIRDMPANYGVPTDRAVMSLTGHRLANDWSDLLDGSIPEDLTASGVLQQGIKFWYSGSQADGSLATHEIEGGTVPSNCAGWTAPDTLLNASYGVFNRTDEGWIARGLAGCGDTRYHVLCVGW